MPFSVDVIGKVLPASAGMILPRNDASRSALRAPRIRGDDPETAYVNLAEGKCSPHPRG